jgi:hypothetical protein
MSFWCNNNNNNNNININNSHDSHSSNNNNINNSHDSHSSNSGNDCSNNTRPFPTSDALSNLSQRFVLRLVTLRPFRKHCRFMTDGMILC